MGKWMKVGALAGALAGELFLLHKAGICWGLLYMIPVYAAIGAIVMLTMATAIEGRKPWDPCPSTPRNDE
jgi:hypothetical protein